MGPHIETKESAAPALLVLSTESILVRITLCGVDTPRDGMTANLTRATWGARCGKSARRVLRGGTGTSDLVARLVPTHHSVPHAELMRSVARRVVDGAMLHLIKMWLEAPVEETDERGNKHRSTRNRDEGRGSPQGSPISPLFSNLYMRRFVLGWKKLGHEERLRAYIVNYADDLVICCRDKAADALVTMRGMMTKLKLTVNETKTRVCKLPEEKFDEGPQDLKCPNSVFSAVTTSCRDSGSAL